MAKSSSLPTWLLPLGILVVLVIWGVSQFNGLVTLDEDTNASWANVEAQYQRRVDLIPNLVNVAEGAADFEKSTLIEVTEARTNWLDVSQDPNATAEEEVAATQSLDSSFSRLIATFEAYPNLTSTQAFLNLQTQLEGTENRISVARSDYNGVVTKYNKSVRSFPISLFAKLFGFEKREVFESDPGASEAPVVEFDT